MAELRSTTDGLRPVSEYVLTVHAPTNWDVSNYQATGTFSFESPMMFIRAATPFHVPHVGDELSVAYDGKEWLGANEPSHQVVVVSRVSHRVEASAYGITCKLDVYTEARSRTPTGPDELRHGRTDT